MKTFEFKSERNWNKVCDALSNSDVFKFTSYGYKAITVFDEFTEAIMLNYCKHHRIAVSEIAE